MQKDDVLINTRPAKKYGFGVLESPCLRRSSNRHETGLALGDDGDLEGEDEEEAEFIPCVLSYTV
jgi:hypothetical protein